MKDVSVFEIVFGGVSGYNIYFANELILLKEYTNSIVTQTTEVCRILYVAFFSLFIYKPKFVPEVNTYGGVRKNTVLKSRFAIRIFSSFLKFAFKE